MNALDLEHQTLDRSLADIEFLAQKRLFSRAASRFVEFRAALMAHLDKEDREDRIALDPLMRAQHEAIADSLQQLSEALAESDYAKFCTRLEAFVRQLAEHQATEERMHDDERRRSAEAG